MMDDGKIIELYFARDEQAILETERKYGELLRHMAWNVLGSPEEAEEVANDVLLKAWNSIPPLRPTAFFAWLKKLTRRAAIDVFRTRSRMKRGGTEYALSLSEIAEMASDVDGPEEAADAKALAALISRWLSGIHPEQRRIFLLRYFDCESIRETARLTGSSESRVKVTLFRLRESLAAYLRGEGYVL